MVFTFSQSLPDASQLPDMVVQAEELSTQASEVAADPMVGIAFAVVLVVWGLLNVAIGYRMFRWVLAFNIAIIGFFTAGMAGLMILQDPWVALICALGGAVIGMALGWFLYLPMIFLMGATVGAAGALMIGTKLFPVPDDVLTQAAGSATQGVSPILWFVVVAADMVVGIVSLLARRFILIMLTAINGATYVVLGVFDLLNQTDPLLQVDTTNFATQQAARFEDPIVLWSTLIIAAIGVILQYTVTGKEGQGKLTNERNSSNDKNHKK